MKSNVYTLVFAAVLGVVCATLLTAVGQFTKPRAERNRDADEKLNILMALESTYSAEADAATVLADFETLIPAGEEKRQDGELTLYAYYTYRRDGVVQARAVRFTGDGLWAPIEGYLVLEPDWKTVRALAITRQEETPGLGAEITSESFRAQFKGKRIVADDGSPGIAIVMGGAAAAANEVDGVTGATLTSEALEAMINTLVVEIAKGAAHD